MYGHTKTMKALTDMLDSFRELQKSTGTPNPAPKNWFRTVKLFSDLGNSVARVAIVEEGAFIMEEIRRKAHDLILNNQEPGRIYLGGWEYTVLPEWFNVRSVLQLNYEPNSDEQLIEIAIDGVKGAVAVRESDAETFIEVVAKERT